MKETIGIDGRIIVRWILRKMLWEHGLGRCGSGEGQMVGTCEGGNEPSDSIKCGEFLDQLRTDWLLKKDSAVWSKYEYVMQAG